MDFLENLGIKCNVVTVKCGFAETKRSFIVEDAGLWQWGKEL